MRTDIVLTSAGHRIVMDAKFYKKRVHQRFGKRKLRSSHLYQLQSYLHHFPPGPPMNGVLLYAGDNSVPPLNFCLGGHEVSIRSLDLDQEWQGIRRDLLKLPRSLKTPGEGPNEHDRHHQR
jgi:5-methylcytosine-specific restriction endonuclease McrBC regulatory subunit McrC